MPTKVCNKCHVEKDINEFYERKDSKDGRRNVCIECRKIVDFNRRTRNREKIYQLIYLDLKYV